MEGEDVVVKGKLIIMNGEEKRIRVSTYDLLDDAYYEEDDFYYFKEAYENVDFDFDDDSGDLYY